MTAGGDGGGHRPRGPRHTDPGTAPARAAGHVDVDVLVVGAGPTGLTAACEAARHGLSVRIVDRKASRSAFSKALVVHARTLEVFETMGVAGAVLAEGARFTALNVHAGRRRRAVRIDLLGLPWGDTAYPFWLSVPQYATERVLETHLEALGGHVEWQVALEKLHDHGDHVEAVLTHADGATEVVRSRWLIGCDGGRSRVRDQVGLRLDRSPAGATFVLADVRTTASVPEDEGHVFLGPSGLLLIVPMPEPRLWRIIAHIPEPPADAEITIDADYLNALIRDRSGIEFGGHDVGWRSRFELSHGLADRYRRGRVFLAGDAAHVHSPVGGQGLNTGVQDAHNLVWKLAAARDLDAESAWRLLDGYEAERRPVARAMVRGTARATGALAGSGAVRAVVGAVAPRVIARRAVRARLGRPVGMLEIAYRSGSPAVAADASGLAGRRLPNPALRTGGRLHQRLAATGHTWLVWARPGEAVPDGGPARWEGHPVVVVAEDEIGEEAGWRPGDAARVALVRPDRHVAAAGPTREAVWSALRERTALTGTRPDPLPARPETAHE